MSLDENSVKVSSTQKWGCGLIIVNENGRVLMGHRCKPTDADQWSFAGGSVELGETPKEAVKREAQEEMSLTVKRMMYLGSFELGGVEDFIFMTVEEDCYGIPSPFVKEFSELRWFNQEEFVSLRKNGKLFPASGSAFDLLGDFMCNR